MQSCDHAISTGDTSAALPVSRTAPCMRRSHLLAVHAQSTGSCHACGAGQMPKLELFTSLVRTAMEENSFILEESLDGMQLAAGAYFRSAPEVLVAI